MSPWQLLRAHQSSRATLGYNLQHGATGTVHYSTATAPPTGEYEITGSLSPSSEKQAMQQLNMRLASYLQQVELLEATNRRLEHEIQEELRKRCPTDVKELDELLMSTSFLQEQITDCLSARAQLNLQLLAAELAIFDLNTRSEQERQQRNRVEAENSDLRYLLEVLNVHKLPELQKVLREQKQELQELQERHLLDEQALLNKVSGDVTVAMQTAESSELFRQMDMLRQISAESWAQVCSVQEPILQAPDVTFDLAESPEVAELEHLWTISTHLTEDLKHLQRENAMLEASGRQQTENFVVELTVLQETADRLCLDLDSVLQASAQQAVDHDVLLDVKSRLEDEIQDYMRLLDSPSHQGASLLHFNSKPAASCFTVRHGNVAVNTLEAVRGGNMRSNVIQMFSSPADHNNRPKKTAIISSNASNQSYSFQTALCRTGWESNSHGNLTRVQNSSPVQSQAKELDKQANVRASETQTSSSFLSDTKTCQTLDHPSKQQNSTFTKVEFEKIVSHEGPKLTRLDLITYKSTINTVKPSVEDIKKETDTMISASVESVAHANNINPTQDTSQVSETPQEVARDEGKMFPASVKLSEICDELNLLEDKDTGGQDSNVEVGAETGDALSSNQNPVVTDTTESKPNIAESVQESNHHSDSQAESVESLKVEVKRVEVVDVSREMKVNPPEANTESAAQVDFKTSTTLTASGMSSSIPQTLQMKDVQVVSTNIVQTSGQSSVKPVKTILAKDSDTVEKIPAEEKEPVKTILAKGNETIKTILAKDSEIVKKIPAGHKETIKTILAKDNETVEKIPAEGKGTVNMILKKDSDSIKTNLVKDNNNVKTILAKNSESLEKIPAEEKETVKTIPEKDESIKVILAKDNETVKTILAKDNENVERIPAEEKETVKTIPAKDNEAIKTILAKDNQTAEKIPTEEQETVMIIPAKDNKTVKTISAKDNETVKMILAKDYGIVEKIPAVKKETIKTIPAKDNETIKMILAKDNETVDKLPAEEKETVKTILAKDKGAVEKIPAEGKGTVNMILKKDSESVKTNLVKDNNNVKTILAKNSESLEKIPAEEKETVKTIPEKDNESIKVILAKDNETVKTILAKDNENVERIPVEEKETVKTIPAKDNEAIKTILAKDNQTAEKIPAEEKETVKMILAKDYGIVEKIPAVKKETIKTIPAKDNETIKTILAKDNETVDKIPAEEKETVKKILAKDNGTVQKILAEEKIILVKDNETVEKIPAGEKETVNMTLSKGNKTIKMILAKDNENVQKIPAEEKETIKAIPATDETVKTTLAKDYGIIEKIPTEKKETIKMIPAKDHKTVKTILAKDNETVDKIPVEETIKTIPVKDNDTVKTILAKDNQTVEKIPAEEKEIPKKILAKDNETVNMILAKSNESVERIPAEEKETVKVIPAKDNETVKKIAAEEKETVKTILAKDKESVEKIPAEDKETVKTILAEEDNKTVKNIPAEKDNETVEQIPAEEHNESVNPSEQNVLINIKESKMSSSTSDSVVIASPAEGPSLTETHLSPADAQTRIGNKDVGRQEKREDEETGSHFIVDQLKQSLAVNKEKLMENDKTSVRSDTKENQSAGPGNVKVKVEEEGQPTDSRDCSTDSAESDKELVELPAQQESKDLASNSGVALSFSTKEDSLRPKEPVVSENQSLSLEMGLSPADVLKSLNDRTFFPVNPDDAETCLFPAEVLPEDNDDDDDDDACLTEAIAHVRPVEKYILSTKDEDNVVPETDKRAITAGEDTFKVFEASKVAPNVLKRSISQESSLKKNSSGGVFESGHSNIQSIIADKEKQLGFEGLHRRPVRTVGGSLEESKRTSDIANRVSVPPGRILTRRASDVTAGGVRKGSGEWIGYGSNLRQTNESPSEGSPLSTSQPRPGRFWSGEWIVYGGDLQRKSSLDGVGISVNEGNDESISKFGTSTPVTGRFGRRSSGGSEEWMAYGGRVGHKSNEGSTETESAEHLRSLSPPETGRFGRRSSGGGNERMVYGGRVGYKSNESVTQTQSVEHLRTLSPPETGRFQRRSSCDSDEWIVYGGGVGYKSNEGASQTQSTEHLRPMSPPETGRFERRSNSDWIVYGGTGGRTAGRNYSWRPEGNDYLTAAMRFSMSPPGSVGSAPQLPLSPPGSVGSAPQLPLSPPGSVGSAPQLTLSPPGSARLGGGSGEWRVYGGSGRLSGPPSSERRVTSPPGSYTSRGPRVGKTGSRLSSGGAMKRSSSLGSGGRLNSPVGNQRIGGSVDTKPVYCSAGGHRSSSAGPGQASGASQRAQSPAGKSFNTSPRVQGGWLHSAAAAAHRPNSTGSGSRSSTGGSSNDRISGAAVGRISGSSGSGRVNSTGGRVITSSDRPIRSTGSGSGSLKERISVCKMAALLMSAAGKERSKDKQKKKQQQATAASPLVQRWLSTGVGVTSDEAENPDDIMNL